MYKDKFISCIITAAGMGTRMGLGVPKLELEIAGKTIIEYTIKKIYSTNVFDEIILVTNSDLLISYNDRFSKYKILKVILGGSSREESTYLGLKSLSNNSDIVVCHDGARPFVDKKMIINSIDSAILNGSGVAGVKVKDTIKIVENGVVTSTPPRENLYQIQTPQSFSKKLILKAYDEHFGKISPTDDASYVEALGENVYIIPGDYNNIKITTPEDLIFAKSILEEI